MLTLILGRAGSGKTSYVLNMISGNIKACKAGSILIVPEQYSHDAERELAGVCPYNASLYAEVLSFSRLSSRVFSEVGGLAEKMLDNGGRTLAMSRAVSNVASHLKVYNLGSSKPEFLNSLISAYDELRSACAPVSQIEDASEKAEGSFGTKLADLALIFDSYERIKEKSGLDLRDKLERLAESIGESSIGTAGHIYIDGFTDFTAQEMRVIDELLKKGSDITVCLTCDRIDDPSPAFSLPAATARGLMALASKRRIPCDIKTLKNEKSGKPAELKYLEKTLMDYTAGVYNGTCGNIEIWSCENTAEECAFAASKAISLVRSGCRFRDIAIVSPDWTKYASVSKGIFEKFGVPVNSAEKSDILQKPIMAFVTSALDIMANNWDYASVFRYVKTGLTGVTPEDCDLIENYVLKWNIRGILMWTRAEGWNMHPEGYSESMTEENLASLKRINKIREQISAPLNELNSALKKTNTAVGKAQAIYDFLEDTGLYAKLEDKVRFLESAGKLQTADEYSQLWDILINALTQFAEILGETEIENDEMIRLIKLVLSQYEVGTIPSSVDSVGVGDMARMRGRGIKHLIVIGATDTALPSYTQKNGIFTDDERVYLRELGVELPDPEEDTISRELGLIYASFSMPSDSLTLTYPASSRKSYMLTRLEKLFNLTEKISGPELYLCAPEPAFELAASASDGGREAKLSQQYFSLQPAWANRLNMVKNAALMPRGRLTRMTAEKLYGKNVSVSASRLDRYYSCRFSYFLQYGLRVKPRTQAAFDAPESGTFMHFILERTTREAEKRGGFAKVGDNDLRKMTRSYAQEYAERKLGGLGDKTGRFKYLFSRLSDDAERVVISMAEEMRNSDFKPLDFELKFAYDGDLPPIEVSGQEGKVRINGIVDRVDGWVHGDKLYLRVVDYKTGRKAFSLSDVWYGMGMQMLIYLFALCKEGEGRYMKSIVPAGVLYAPARDVMTQAPHDLTDEELERERLKSVRRSGLLLDDPEAVHAMEKSEKGGYLPVKFTKDGALSGDSLASLERLGALSKHIDMLISQMGDEIRAGSITADPYFRGQLDNACLYCDYFDACHFNNGTGDDKARYLTKLATPEAWAKLEEAQR